VQVLGWNPEDATGVFTGDFENLDNGRNVAQSFVDEGADVIFPVAGPVGLGSAALAQELDGVWVLGVDADWFITAPDFADVTLTSVLKGLDVAVYSAIEAVANGTFAGGTALYTIADDGVGLGGVNEAVPADLVTEIEQLTADVKSGAIVPGDYLGG
jgi:basic membrane protein A